MLEILRNLQQSAPISFSLVAVNLDQKQPGFPEHVLPEYLEKLGVEYKIVEENTYGLSSGDVFWIVTHHIVVE